ncbi:MAG: hypothetical protein ABSG91_01845, partial [Syntrophobacteraceae bacterium]
MNSDVHAVQNPENSEIGYCSIMGALGEMLGLAVYPERDHWKLRRAGTIPEVMSGRFSRGIV